MGASLSKIVGHEKKISKGRALETDHQQQQSCSAADSDPSFASVSAAASNSSTRRTDSESTLSSRCPLKKVFRSSGGSRSETPFTVVESENEGRGDEDHEKGNQEYSNERSVEEIDSEAFYCYSGGQEAGKLITAAAARLSEEFDRKKRAAAAYQRKYCLTPCQMAKASVESLSESINKDIDDDVETDTNTPPLNTQSENERSPSCTVCPKKVTIEEVLKNLYYHPASEEERRKDKDRQQRMHYLLKRVWNGIYRVDLQNPQLIIDWRCGMGVWDVEMATRFPNAKVVGIDFKEATPTHLQPNLPNLQFISAVPTDKHAGFEAVQNDSVDFVFMRDTWLTNSPQSKWDNLLAEVFRVLRPGGYLEIEEHVLETASKGPNTKHLFSWYDTFFEALNANRRTVVELEPFIFRAGFINLKKVAATIPLGEWPQSAPLKEIGYLFKDLVERRVRGMARWVAEACNIDEGYLHETVTKVMDEEADKNRACLDWISYTAQKPKYDI